MICVIYFLNIYNYYNTKTGYKDKKNSIKLK